MYSNYAWMLNSGDFNLHYSNLRLLYFHDLHVHSNKHMHYNASLALGNEG